jgi:hypothetical protein
MVGTAAVGRATAGEPAARQDEPAAGAARVDLQKAADVQALAILEFLSKSRAKVWSGYRGDPEQRKLLEKIHIAIRWLQELDGRDALTEAQRGMAARLLAANPVMYGVDPLIALMDDWDRLLIETRDETYVRTLLAAELVRSSSRTSVVVWSRLFGQDPPFWLDAILSGRRLEPEEIAGASNQLLELYRTRTIDYELARARIHMTSRLLWWLSPFLAILVGGLMIALTSRESVWIASFAGALGALVSGALRVRDQVKQINALRAFWPVVVVQPLLGAAAGLFLYLIANVGVKGVLSADLLSSENAWALYGVLGFVAGFSEPIFLGVIDKFAELVDPKEGSSPPAAGVGGPPA